jgi:hypothetical protein
MTATIQEERQLVIVKDLYFKSPVVVQEYDKIIDDFKIYSMEEQDARSWISEHH